MSSNIVKLSLSSIVESKFNPRTVCDPEKLMELGASMKASGQQQPIKVREASEGKFEIVFGHRRFRAAKLVKLDGLDGVIVKMNDEEVALAQIVENGQREDITPLEEADSYRVMQEKFNKSADDIAALIGKSKSHVYARLKLAALKDAGRKALASGKIDPEVALLIARVPTEKLQTKAVRELTTDRWSHGVTFRDAAEHIQRHFMLTLADAPWKMTDEALNPEAGSCRACPKRTGNIPAELRTDVKGADICTDVECFRSKLDAAAKLILSASKEQGIPVLPKTETEKVFSSGARYVDPNSGFIDVNDVNPNDPKRRTWKQLMGKDLPPVSLAKDPDGYVRELVEEGVLKKALKETGVGQPTPEQKAETDAERADKAKEREARAMRVSNVETIFSKLLSGADKVRELALLRSLVTQMPWHTASLVAARNEVDYGKDWPKYASGLSTPSAKAVLLEGIVHGFTDAYVKEGMAKGFRETLAEFGIDLAETEKETKAEMKSAERGEEEAKAKSKAKGPLARKAKAKK